MDVDDEGYSAVGQFKVYIMQSKTSYMAPSKSRIGEAATKEESGEFKQHLGGSYKTCLLTRVLVKRAFTVHIIIKIE